MPMAVDLQRIGEEVGRQRRAHKKSRLGCRNCKLRRVKCDEARPKCNKCTDFGVSCNYDPKAPDLQMSIGRRASVKCPQKPPCSIDQLLLGMIGSPAHLYPAISDSNSTFQFDGQSMDRLGRFQRRTVLTVGSPRTAQLNQREIVKLACSHPYLMHVVQTITAIHDRYLSAPPNARLTTAEVYHWSQAAASFNRKLSTPFQPHDRDALWATAALLGVIAFALVEGATPGEAWPLKPSAPSDLEWLRMSDGKKAIWKVADPFSRPDSVFHTIADDHGNLFFAPARSVIEGIPSAFIQLYDLDKSSVVDSNPYYDAVQILASLLPIECDQSNVPRLFCFIIHMQPDFKRLLELKDPRALLLLAYWYAKVCHSQWWIARRATLECQATCLYLERHHAGETAILELLQFPKIRCGLLP